MVENKKNVLIMFADQLMKYALGCMNNPDVYTPNIDRLAQNGTLFKSAYSATPICSPFRANLVTGMYNLETGADANCCTLPKNCHSLVDDFNDAGYKTSFVGKWHVGIGGNNPIEEKYRTGFQDVMGYQCYNSFYANVRFFDSDNKPHDFDKHRTDVTGDMAIKKLQEMGDDPFMMVVGFQAPHYPEQPAPRFDRMYRGKKVTPRPNYSGLDPYIPTVHPRSPRPAELDPDFRRYGEDIHEYLRCYYALVTQVDDNVGRILDYLEDSGKIDNTIVMFTSDHGDMAGSHNLNGKGTSHEESTGIPMILSGPSVPKGLRVSAPIDSSSFLPTCMDMVGIDMPERIKPRVRTQLLETPNADTVAFSSFVTRDWCMIRKGTKKLTIDWDTNEPTMFFDVRFDPYELDNRVDQVKDDEEYQDMLKALLAWKEDCCAYRKSEFNVEIGMDTNVKPKAPSRNVNI